MRFHDVAEYFFHEVSTARSYVTGGTSNAEGWLAPPRRLAAELRVSPNTAECCCAYNMLKLTRHLYAWSPDPRYFDYYERLLLNHRIGTIRPTVGTTQYYLSLTPGVWKTFNTEDQTFWCCTGTGIEEYAKLTDSIYWRDESGVFVNLFIPSELHWPERGFRLRQETRYPEEERTTLVVVDAGPADVEIRVRVPGWLRSAPAVRINGKDARCFRRARQLPDHHAVIGNRAIAWTWRCRCTCTSKPCPTIRSMQAFLYGPLVLAGDLGTDGLTEAHIAGPNLRVGAADIEQHGSPLGPVNRTPPIPDLDIPTFRAAGPDPSSWIKPADRPAGVSHGRAEAGRDAVAAEQAVRPALLGLLAGVVTLTHNGSLPPPSMWTILTGIYVPTTGAGSSPRGIAATL